MAENEENEKTPLYLLLDMKVSETPVGSRPSVVSGEGGMAKPAGIKYQLHH